MAGRFGFTFYHCKGSQAHGGVNIPSEEGKRGGQAP